MSRDLWLYGDVLTLCNGIVEWRQSKGFETPGSIDSPDERGQMLAKLMLVVTEVAEAAEAVRHNDLDNFKEEVADIAIRIFDIAGTMGFDLQEEIRIKMLMNMDRPFRHGKETIE